MAEDAQAPYRRVAAAFLERIEDGIWPPGHRMPSRPELCQEFGVGENVIRRAQELLIRQGLLEGRVGAGTYVRTPHQRHVLHRSPNSGPGVAPAGFHGSWEVDSDAHVPAPPAIAARLAIGEGEPCVRTTYEALSADRRPAMLCTSWEPMAVTAGTPVLLPESGPLAGRGVTARMAHIGVTVSRIIETPRPVRLDRDQAHLLGTSIGVLATRIERTHYDVGGRPVETADVLAPADRWDIIYDLPLSMR